MIYTDADDLAESEAMAVKINLNAEKNYTS